MTAYLLLRGFVLQNIKRNYNNSGKNVFYFRDSNELKEAIEQFNKYKDCLINCLIR